MGCSSSKLDDEEAVKLCKDRKRFIKQALEQRIQFASNHIAYIQSLRRVSSALRDYIEGDEPREFLLDSYSTPTKKVSHPSFIPIASKPFSIEKLNSGLEINYLKSRQNQSITIEERPESPINVTVQTYSPVQHISKKPNSGIKVNYLRSNRNPSIPVEERLGLPENVRVETYPSMHHFEYDGFFSMQSPSMNSFSYSPNNYRPNIPPPSPQPSSQWDFFWNPFSSLDYYGYPTRSSLDQTVNNNIADDEDIMGLRQVREEEGIPDLEEESDAVEAEMNKPDLDYDRDEVIVEDVDDEEEDETEIKHEVKVLRKDYSTNEGVVKVSEAKPAGQVEVSSKQERAVGDKEKKEEKPGFTVYVNKRPTSMEEVIKDLEAQFLIVCNSASEVASMLEASRAQYSSTQNEPSAMKMLNPVTLFRSASSRSTSSRFLMNSLSSKEEGYESSSDFSEESCMFAGSHQSTLDRLHAWEKKLYEEVRAGEKVRIAYEKKCMQLRNQDVKGADPSAMDKTRAAITDLHTQIKVSIQSVKAVSKRIETLRDEELQPQLLELIQGLARMWKVMAECHQMQKHTLDEAKLLLAGTPSKLAKEKKHNVVSSSVDEPHRLARSAASLEFELRNWRASFESWLISQKSYVSALTGWLLRCIQSDPDTDKFPFSPRRSNGAPSIFGICIQWSKFLNAVHDVPVLDSLDFFAAGMGSLYAQQLKEDSRRVSSGSKRFESKGDLEVVEFGKVVEEEEEGMSAEKLAEIAVRVLCAGMSVAVSSLAEFAIGSADGYAQLVGQWENAKSSNVPVDQGA